MRRLGFGLGLLLCGCQSVAELAPPPPVPEGTFGVIVSRLGTDDASLWVPSADGAVALVERGASLHWLALPIGHRFGPLKAGEVFQLLPGDAEGIPLSIRQMHVLVSGDGESRWDEMVVPLEQLHVVDHRSTDELCDQLNACYAGANCTLSCDQTKIAEPDFSGTKAECPPGWVDTGTNGDQFCFPELWTTTRPSTDQRDTQVPELPVACEQGTYDLGEGCVAIPCEAGRFPAEPAGAGDVVYVDAAAGPGGTGTRADPFSSLEAAWAQHEVILLAHGEYTVAALGVNDGVSRTLVGSCSADVTLRSSVLVRGGELDLSGVTLTSTEGVSLRVTAGQLSLRNATVVGAINGLVHEGGTVSATDTYLYALPIAGQRDPTHVLEGERIVGERVSIKGQVMAQHTEIILQDSLLAGNAHGDFELVTTEGDLTVTRGSTLTLDRVQIHAARRKAISVSASLVALHDVWISTEGSEALRMGQCFDFKIDRVVGFRRGDPEALDETGEQSREPGFSFRDSDGTANNVASVNFYVGWIVRDDNFPDISVDSSNVWIRFTGRRGLQIENTLTTANMRNVWIQGLALVSDRPDTPIVTNTAALKANLGTLNIDGLHLRPGDERNAISLDDSAKVGLRNIEVLGVHLRTLFLERGADGTIDRLNAETPAGGLALIETGDPIDNMELLHISDISLSRSQGLMRGIEGRGVRVLFERFDFRGHLDMSPEAEVELMTFVDGRIERPADLDEWPTEDLYKRFTNVRVIVREE